MRGSRGMVAQTVWLVVLAVLVAVPRAEAYLVQRSASLDQMAQQADIVIKAEVLSIAPVADPWFSKTPGFASYAARVRVSSVLKGAPSLRSTQVSFHYYGKAATQVGYSYSPQHYELEVGRSYILFGKKGPGSDVYRQLWKSHRTKRDQGVLLCASNHKHRGRTIAEAYWTELTALLESRRDSDARYALAQLDAMSGGQRVDVNHFERKRVLARVAPLLRSSNREVAAAAIEVLGSRNPYWSERFAPAWLATVGHGHIPGLSKWDITEVNLGAKLHWRALARVANGRRHPGNRALAIRALGRSLQPQVARFLGRWLRDKDPEVRAAAAVLLADFPRLLTPKLVGGLCADPQPVVRRAVAHLIGFSQEGNQVACLASLLGDSDKETRAAAAMSLLSLPLAVSASTMRANLGGDYRPLFINALASQDPGPHLAALADIVAKNPSGPSGWWGGRVIWGVSWDILFGYVKKQPSSALESGKLDFVLDALESPKAGYYSSSEPRDLYALYLQKGMLDRARRFRAAASKKATYDLGQYLDMVDKDPSQYQRR